MTTSPGNTAMMNCSLLRKKRKEKRKNLPWYKLPDDKIVIKPYTDPTSSRVNLDKGDLLEKMEELFENRYKVGQQFRDAWERMKNQGDDMDYQRSLCPATDKKTAVTNDRSLLFFLRP